MAQWRDSLASQHIDYYVVLSKHIYCDFSSISVMWLEISPTNIAIPEPLVSPSAQMLQFKCPQGATVSGVGQVSG